MRTEITAPCRRRIKIFLALAFTASFVSTINAADPEGLPSPTWDRAAALQASAVDQPQLSGWMQMINTGNAGELLSTLQHSSRNSSPALEAQLFDLALALAEAPDDPAIDALLNWLASYSPAVLVAHEEKAEYGVPLYPVAAAAMGSAAERQRQRARIRTTPLAEDSPELWVRHYLAASAVEQQGISQALRAASPDSTLPLALTLQQQLPQHPELALPAAELASLLVDPQLFLAAYQFGQGATSVNILREVNWRLDTTQRHELLTGVLALGSEEKSALAISMLAPSLHGNSELNENLLQLLDDPELGAVAALALVGHPDPQVQYRLQDLLQAGGLKGRRAAMALDQALVAPPDPDLQ